MATSARFAAMIERASIEPRFRGALVWFPDRVISEYELEGPEAHAARTLDLTGLELADDVRVKALEVFDLHDLHAGE